jgi:hypothetical protein
MYMGSGGGGSAGKVSWPSYLQDVHHSWLNDTDTDFLDTSITAAMNASFDDNPYLGETAYNPTTELATAWSEVSDLKSTIESLNYIEDYESAVAQAITSAEVLNSEEFIVADVNAYSAILEDQLNAETLPAFQAGMLNISAINTSAFAIGESIMRGFKSRDVAKYSSELRYRLHLQRNEFVRTSISEMLQVLLTRADLWARLAQLSVEAKRVHIVAQKEYLAEQLTIDVNEARWELDTFQYGANLLGSISGGVVPSQKGPSQAQSAIGGATSGAAAGALVGAQIGGSAGIYGAAIGAVVGAGAALLA